MPATRQLTAILFADIQGYTAFMQEDEAHAHLLRDKLKKNLEHQMAVHNGRMVKLSGDGALCIFNSAIEAVRAAIEIQKEMRSEPIVPLRIGIHAGDVMFEDGDVFGDGVNVASRIESFALAGGVFISDRVYADIKNQKDITTISLGKYDLKNVSAPVEIFVISNEGLVVPEKKKKLEGKGQRDTDKKFQSRNILIGVAVIMIAFATYFFRQNIFSLSNVNAAAGKSIAVLPFENLSSNKDDEYFADGMCDEILTQISKIADLKVISRTSVLQYKNTTKNLRQIGEELGVNTVLEGTVQKLNGRVRINVQLINATTDEHIWAQDYDRDLKDVFAIQSQVAEQIAHELEAKFTEQEKQQIERIPTHNLDAYNLYIKANALFNVSGNGDNPLQANSAIEMMQQAVALDSNFTLAWCKLVQMQTDILWIAPNDSLLRKSAKDALDHAIRLEPDLPEVHLAIGTFRYHADRDFAGALRELDIAQKGIPNNSTLLMYRALVLRRQGKWKEALASIDKAFELDPGDIFLVMNRADLEFATCNYAEASRMLEQAKEIGINENDYYNNKCSLTLLTGSVQNARKVFDAWTTKPEESMFKMPYLYRMNSLEGKYAEVIKIMMPFTDSIVLGYTSGSLLIALHYHYLHDETKAKMYFERARVTLEKQVSEHPHDFNYPVYCYIGLAYAGLGDAEKAVSNLKRAEEMLPVETDAVDGLFAHQMLAMSYSLLNKKDEAIEELQFLQRHVGYYESDDATIILKPDPIWNNMKGDSRFEKMWEGNALKPLFKL